MFYNYSYEIMKATDLTKKGIIGMHIKNSMLSSHIDVIAMDKGFIGEGTHCRVGGPSFGTRM